MNTLEHSKGGLEIIERSVRLALEEDIGNGDVTASLFNIDQTHNAKVICREEAVLCGQQWFNETFHQLDTNIEITWLNKVGTKTAAVYRRLGNVFTKCGL